MKTSFFTTTRYPTHTTTTTPTTVTTTTGWSLGDFMVVPPWSYF